MGKVDYRLSVEFRTDQTALLYEGPSFYNRNVIDDLIVRMDGISIMFSRMKSAHPEEYIYSERSTIRFQLYRAACFYLIVTGSLPEVKGLSLSWPGGAIELDQKLLINHWEHCKISVCWPKNVAARCFSKDGRVPYIVMTYCLKAQLDLFPHDAFRAAWSALNGMYNQLLEKGREGDKIKALKEVIQKKELPEAEKYTETLDHEFWRHLQWYNYVQTIGMQKAENMIFDVICEDRMLYQHLSHYLCSVYKKTKPQRVKEITAKTEKIAKAKDIHPREQVDFLVADYCYMLRNRSFHAAKPYPIFVMRLDEMENEEQKLTKLILLTIRDLMEQGCV